MDDSDFKAAMPKTPLNFYTRLYCKKRKLLGKVKGHTVLMEATKSWLSLTKSEKEVFITKYNSALTEYNKKVGEYLKNAEPYLKKRDPKRLKNADVLQSNINTQKLEISFNNEGVENILGESSRIVNFSNSSVNNMSEDIDRDRQQLVISTNKHDINNVPIRENVPEPILPKVKSAKDLYEILTKNEDNCDPWESLASIEKRR
ncbi:unnamed protein product, partial [Iphiclides podalirius]